MFEFSAHMPEGPEIRRAADRISKVVVGRPLSGVRFLYPSITEYQESIEGARIQEITTRGKAMLTRFDNGWTLYSHNQLYGRWTVHLRSTEVTWNRSLRVEFLTEKKAVRLWSATDLSLFPSVEEAIHPFLSRLGPDVLDRNVSVDDLEVQLRSKGCRNRKAAHLMLDQKAFAGLGNYLRSEILFVAGVHPDARPSDLDDSTLRAWSQAIKQITVQAYETGGITVDPDTAERGKIAGEPRRTWRHHAFCRNNRPCLACGDLVTRIRYGGRRLDFCPSCQPRID